MSNPVNLKLYDIPVKKLSEETIKAIFATVEGSNAESLKDIDKKAYDNLREYSECLALRKIIENKMKEEGSCRVMSEFNGDGISYRAILNWLDWLNEDGDRVGLQMNPGDYLQSFYLKTVN